MATPQFPPMGLEDQITSARKEIVSDGYDMSVGEVISLYQNQELFISPVFQRLYRWDPSRKTRFIESLLLGIPIPPIFVYQNADGVWELIDGLQRISTILEFVGVLRDTTTGETRPPLVLEGTNFLPSLSNTVWSLQPPEGRLAIGLKQQLQIKRARIRVEILKQESDVHAKYELFQRLNTGGVGLSEQEVRNCVAVMIDEGFYTWLKGLAETEDFQKAIDQTEHSLQQQTHVELALRFFAFRHVPYSPGLDVHEYLDSAMMEIIDAKSFDRASEERIFLDTFKLVNQIFGENAFKKWNGTKFTGMFLMSLFEIVAIGISKKLKFIERMNNDEQKNFLESKVKALWNNPIFIKNNGAGVRGTTRLTNLLPLADSYFHEE